MHFSRRFSSVCWSSFIQFPQHWFDLRHDGHGGMPYGTRGCCARGCFALGLQALGEGVCRNLGFQMRALSASAIRRPLTWLLSERYIRARSLLLYPYVFVAGPNKHDPFIELVTERKFQHEQPTELA